MRRWRVAAVVAVMALAMTSCTVESVTFGKLQTGSEMTDEIRVPLPGGAAVTDVTLAMGGGQLTVDVGAVGALVDGTVTYNLEEIKPSVLIQGNEVRIEQGDIEGKRITIGNWGDVVNRWELKLGTAPMTLTVNAGAAQTALNRLGDLNATEIALNGGAGDFTLGFQGELGQDMDVSIDAGAAQVTIVVPATTPAEVTFKGALTNINAWDAWTKSGDAYVLEGTGPRLTFTVRMGVGSLDLRNP